MRLWPILKVGECAEIQMGQSPPGETYNSEGIGLPFFQGKAEFGEEYPTTIKWCSEPSRIAEAGDILLSVRAPVGPTNFALEQCCIGRGLAAIRAKSNACNQRYLRYYFKRFETDIAARGVGSTFSAINRTDIERLELPVPPLAEQHRIVNLLDEADGLRTLRAKADRATFSLIPALFDETFGNPVTNPRKWPQSTMGEQLSLLEYGPRFYNESYSESGVRIARITDIDVHGNLRFESMPKLMVESKVREKRCLQPGDLLFARSGATVGKTAVLNQGDPECIAGAYFIRLRFNASIHSLYAKSVLDSPPIKSIIVSQSVQSAQQNFSGPGIRTLPFPVPPLNIQKMFADSVIGVRSLKSQQSASHDHLDDLFLAMLHRAFRGKL
jgi:type I restriction enzyme, S subunit